MKTQQTPNTPWTPLTLMPTWLGASQPLLSWWAEQSPQAMQPFAKAQLAWMESISEAMQAEMQFFQALTASQEKMAQCMLNATGTSESNQNIANCYQEVVQNLTDAQMTRLQKATKLNHDFRRTLWEQL